MGVLNSIIIIKSYVLKKKIIAFLRTENLYLLNTVETIDTVKKIKDNQD
jgi:hypothetical protein